MDEDLGLQNVGTEVAVDIDIMKIYLEKLLVILLGAEQTDLDMSLFSFPDSTERLRRFASDAQTPALYVLKETESDACKCPGTFSYSFRVVDRPGVHKRALLGPVSGTSGTHGLAPTFSPRHRTDLPRLT